MLSLDKLQPLVGQKAKSGRVLLKVCHPYNRSRRVAMPFSGLKTVLLRIWFGLFAAAVLGMFVLAFVLSARSEWALENDILFPLFNFAFTGLMNIANQLDRRPKPRWPQARIANWSTQIAALIACYVSWIMPKELLTATLLTSFLSLFLWLALVQAYRRLLRDKARREIASELQRGEDDPSATSLANNSDLATAVVTSVFLTAQTIALLDTVNPGLSSLLVRLAGFMVGYCTGLAYFVWCPNQTDIREHINKRRVRSDPTTT